MGDDVPGIIRIYYKERMSSGSSFRAPESSQSYPQPPPYLGMLAKRFHISLSLLFYSVMSVVSREGQNGST